MGIASMVIGIVALVIGFVPFCGTWAVIPAVAGLGLGIADLIVKTRSSKPRGMAVAGLIMNPLAIVVIVLWYFLFIYGTAAAVESVGGALGNAMQQQMQQQMQQPSNIPSVPLQPAPPMQPMQPMQPVPVQPLQPQPSPPPAR